MGHPGLIPAINSVHMIALDLLDLVHGHIASKRNLRERERRRERERGVHYRREIMSGLGDHTVRS